jgi:hypothetical protein
MNANDLADRLEEFYKGTHIQKAAEVLRRQADEITVLHQVLGYEGVAVDQEYMDECVAELRKEQEK